MRRAGRSHCPLAEDPGRAGVTAPVAILDYQPRLRHVLEKRFGTTTTDTVLAVACASVYTASQAWTSLAVDMLLHLAKAAESRAEQRVWAEREPVLAMHARCEDSFTVRRPCPLPPGPVERHGDRSALAQLVGVARAFSAYSQPQLRGDCRRGRGTQSGAHRPETFASTLARGLSENCSVLPLRVDALRRLDRVDAVLVDPLALWGPMNCGSAESVARWTRIVRRSGSGPRHDSRRARCAAAGTSFPDRGRRMAMAARVCRCWCGGHTTRLRRRWSGRRGARAPR